MDYSTRGAEERPAARDPGTPAKSEEITDFRNICKDLPSMSQLAVSPEDVAAMGAIALRKVHIILKINHFSSAKR
jgi:hypothetical protein